MVKIIKHVMYVLLSTTSVALFASTPAKTFAPIHTLEFSSISGGTPEDEWEAALIRAERRAAEATRKESAEKKYGVTHNNSQPAAPTVSATKIAAIAVTLKKLNAAKAQ